VSFHEPYFPSYAREDLPGLFAEAGLEPVSPNRCFCQSSWCATSRGVLPGLTCSGLTRAPMGPRVERDLHDTAESHPRNVASAARGAGVEGVVHGGLLW
jgi:hypothetical protein